MERGITQFLFAAALLVAAGRAVPAQALIVGANVSAPGTSGVCDITLNGSSPTQTGHCTGTLIDPTHVLTAGHCGPMGGAVEIACAEGTEFRSARGWLASPRYQAAAALADPQLVYSIDDAGIYELDEPFDDKKVVPIPRATTSAEIEAAAGDPSQCLLAGYGPISYVLYTQDAKRPGGRKTSLRMTSWEPPQIEWNPGNPKEAESHRLWSYFVVSGPSHYVTPGDSGGPVLCPRFRSWRRLLHLPAETPWTVVAVHSVLRGVRVTNVMVQLSYSSWTTNHEDWVFRAVQGHLPEIQIVTSPFGDPFGSLLDSLRP